MGNWTEVPFSYFHIPQVPNLIKSKTEGAKNKCRKAQEANKYLTYLKIINLSNSKQPHYIYIKRTQIRLLTASTYSRNAIRICG
jgi:hypothetical protein